MILTTCKYFDFVVNRCSRVTDGKCSDLQDCEFKYIAELKAENERLKEEIKEVKKYQYEQEYLEKEIETVKVNLDIGKEEARHYLHEAYKFQKCLQEIKAIVKNICDGCTSECDCDEDCNYFLITEQLTKVEEE